MSSKNVLLIEDNIELQTLISAYLKDYQYHCSAYAQPLEALEEFEKNHSKYAIVILDLGLPQMDGFDLFKKLKEIKNIPIIISTARDDIGNKIYGFELGADDYLAKPYEPRELVLRIDATLKRYNKTTTIVCGELTVDLEKKSVFYEKQEIELTKIESEIFFAFVANANKVLSREDIAHLTSLKEEVKNRTIDTHISNIRFKIGDNSKESKYIKSIWEIGYKFIYDN